MEEKKVCTECENKEQKLEELTQEEADQVAGGWFSHWTCPNCFSDNYKGDKTCSNCGFERGGIGGSHVVV